MKALIKKLGQSLTFLRLASLIAGTTLWFYVLNSEPVSVEQEFALQLSLPEGQAVSNEWPKSIKVQLKGARVFLETIDPHQMIIMAEASAAPRRQVIRLTPSMVPLPFGVEVVSIIPDTINLQLVKEAAKTLKVKPQINGDAGPDVAFDIVKIEPPAFKVLGPWSLLKDMRELPTVAANWGDFDASKGVAKLNLRDLDPRLKIDGASEVELHFKVKPKKANTTLKNIPIRFLSSHRRIVSKTSKVALDVLVTEGSEGLLSSGNVQVVADIPEGKKGTLQVELRALLPEGIHLLQIHPPSINITVK